MPIPARHWHRCACGREWNCADADCTVDLCDQCEADLYWDARAPEDIQDETQDTHTYHCADPAQRTLEF